MRKSENNLRQKKSKRKGGYLILLFLITLGIMVLCLPYIGKEKTADKEIQAVISQLEADITRDQVARIMEAGGFSVNTVSPPKAKNRQIYLKIAGKKTFSWVRYDVFIEYNKEGVLQFTRFLKSNHSDGQDTSCLIVFEIPAPKNIVYPILCPEKVQDF